jgi:hypothetical protein
MNANVNNICYNYKPHKCFSPKHSKVYGDDDNLESTLCLNLSDSLAKDQESVCTMCILCKSNLNFGQSAGKQPAISRKVNI